jgi:hypothetical protein
MMWEMNELIQRKQLAKERESGVSQKPPISAGEFVTAFPTHVKNPKKLTEGRVQGENTSIQTHSNCGPWTTGEVYGTLAGSPLGQIYFQNSIV